jgi:hypothetical protein
MDGRQVIAWDTFDGRRCPAPKLKCTRSRILRLEQGLEISVCVQIPRGIENGKVMRSSSRRETFSYIAPTTCQV